MIFRVQVLVDIESRETDDLLVVAPVDSIATTNVAKKRKKVGAKCGLFVRYA